MVVAWVNVPFWPVTVRVKVPRGACGLAERFSVEVPVAVAGFGKKLAVTFDGTPEMLSVTELLAPTAVRLIVADVFDFRLRLIAAGAEMLKSPAGAFTVTDSAVV
jgi:hypothetical protein